MAEDRKEVGLSHWEEQRKEFTKNNIPYSPNKSSMDAYKENPLLQDVEECHFDAIYELMVSGRKFIKHVPLSFVIVIMVHGWKKDGLLPIDWPKNVKD
ncbi:hypothetical protein HDV01_007647 [Terramyces sp. JEL0728]|nr:hypothetical protein HDV01_007647 [Terramyces sp. JEL0728]